LTEISEIAKLLKEHEKRITDLEKLLKNPKEVKKVKKREGYSGLVGGIQLLLDDKFFVKPVSVKEIFAELKIRNYHYPKTSVSKILAADFLKKKRTLDLMRNRLDQKISDAQ